MTECAFTPGWIGDAVPKQGGVSLSAQLVWTIVNAIVVKPAGLLDMGTLPTQQPEKIALIRSAWRQRPKDRLSIATVRSCTFMYCVSPWPWFDRAFSPSLLWTLLSLSVVSNIYLSICGSDVQYIYIILNQSEPVSCVPKWMEQSKKNSPGAKAP